MFIAQLRKDEQPINENIKVKELMVIGPNGEQMGIKKIEDALTLAAYAGLDLVLMSGNQEKAVGKIMDYNKYRYEKQKKVKEQQKKQRENAKEMKEYRLTYNIDVGDFETRRKNAYEYLAKGHKIKGSIRFRGRELAHASEGEAKLNKFAEALSDIADVEQKPVMEGRNMTIILAPKNNK